MSANFPMPSGPPSNYGDAGMYRLCVYVYLKRGVLRLVFFWMTVTNGRAKALSLFSLSLSLVHHTRARSLINHKYYKKETWQ
jgi:hypothetical protein